MSKRSRILVDPSVQWSIAGRIIIHWGLFLLCLVSISAMVRVMISVGNQPFADALGSAVRSQIPTLGVMLLLLPVFLRDTLKLSNRFAGPMYRLRTALDSLALQQPTNPINFRDGDFWQKAASDFNVVLKRQQMLEEENESLKAELGDRDHAAELCER